MILYCFLSVVLNCALAQSTRGVEIGLPEAWAGDAYRNEICISNGIPEWLNGYFLIQTSAAYGKRTDPVGKKLTHMFDGLGAVASLELTNGRVRFSAKYYPARPYKIWNYYDRDMSKSKISWDSIRSAYNATSFDMWNQIQDDETFPIHPNIDFWQIGRTVVGATEFVRLGMQFNVSILDDFKSYPFRDTDRIFQGLGPIIPLTMAVHERTEPDGSIYSACAAFDPNRNRMYQIVFKITPSGVRTLEGLYEHGQYDPTKCTVEGRYTGDRKTLAGYMHSITSTKRYVILPVTSYVLNPCKLPPILDTLQRPPGSLPLGVKENPIAMEFATDVPLRFLIFDKSSRRFVTERPIQADPPMFITHQFNAYEDDDGTLIADMIGTDNAADNLYDQLTVDNLITRGLSRPFVTLSRYKIDLKIGFVRRTDLLPDNEKLSLEYPQYNRKYMELKYKFGYAVVNPYTAGSKLLKIDVDTGKMLTYFSAPGAKAQTAVFREPWFVSRPNSKREDDGVLLAVAGDVLSKTSFLYVIDAQSFRLIGQAEIPTFIPFGFHNRFYSRESLGLQLSNFAPQEMKPNNFNINTTTVGVVSPQFVTNSTPMPIKMAINTASSDHPLPNSKVGHMQQIIGMQNQPSKMNNVDLAKLLNYVKVASTTMMTNGQAVTKRGNLMEDSYGLPTTSLTNVNWANLVEQGKSLVCSLFKEAIDKAGSKFCDLIA